MDPLNDLVWTDEDESDIMPAAIDGPPMPQICEISEATCFGGGGESYPPYNFGSNTVGSDSCGC